MTKFLTFLWGTFLFYTSKKLRKALKSSKIVQKKVKLVQNKVTEPIFLMKGLTF